MEQVGTFPEQRGNSPGIVEEQSRNGKEAVQSIPGEQISAHPEVLLQSSELIAVGEFDSISCNQFMKRYEINRHQFYELRDAISVDTSKGLSPTLHKAFKILAEKQGWIKPAVVLDAPQAPAGAEEAAKGGEIVVSAGRDETALTLDVPKDFGLADLRSSDPTQVIEDPLAVAGQALALMDAVSDAMKQDLENQKAKLRATQAAVSQMETRAGKLQLEKLQYQLEDRITAELQNPATAKLQKLLGVVENVQTPQAGSNDLAGPSQSGSR